MTKWKKLFKPMKYMKVLSINYTGNIVPHPCYVNCMAWIIFTILNHTVCYMMLALEKAKPLFHPIISTTTRSIQTQPQVLPAKLLVY